MKWMIIIWGLLSRVGCQSKPEGLNDKKENFKVHGKMNGYI